MGQLVPLGTIHLLITQSEVTLGPIYPRSLRRQRALAGRAPSGDLASQVLGPQPCCVTWDLYPLRAANPSSSSIEFGDSLALCQALPWHNGAFPGLESSASLGISMLGPLFSALADFSGVELAQNSSWRAGPAWQCLPRTLGQRHAWLRHETQGLPRPG